jgi:hypothetical protein
MRTTTRPGSLLAFVALLALIVLTAPGARAAIPSGTAASAAAWDRVGTSALRASSPSRPLVAPERFAAFRLDQDALAKVLAAAPAERRRTAAPAAGEGLVVSIPTPTGGFARFAIVDSPIMAPGLAAAHPDITTYTGRGVDDPTATVRLDLTPIGFHASVRSDAGAWYVDPRYRDLSQYVAYDRAALTEDPYAGFTEGEDLAAPAPAPRDDRAGEPNGGLVTLRVYRLALVSDYNYANNTPGNTTAAKVALMNRVNQLYEQDFAIRMDLIAGNDALNLDTAAATTSTGGPCGTGACFTAGTLNCNSGVPITRSNVVAGRIAGAGSYDIAHLVLGVSGGGIAGVGVVGGSSKGRGCTGLANPVGDFFAVDYVAHEMGHQFGGDHTFNGTQSNCATSNRATGATTVEPGSGTSVMSYAGICQQDNLQAHSDPYFSQASITQMSAYVNQPEGTLVPQQQAILDGFSGTDAFTITYNGNASATIARGTNYTAAGIKAAIEGIAGWPAGATVTVGDVTDTGFLVSFGGSLAAGTPAALGFSALAGATGFFGAIATAGPTTRGGTASATANHAPSVTAAGTAFTIPVRTPFRLDATGSDADGEPLTYLWEQNDPGTQNLSGGTALVNDTKTNGPLFRMFGTAARYADPSDAYATPSPGENGATGTTSRSFPDLAQVVAGNTNAATGACPAAPAAPTTVPDATVDCLSEFLPTSSWVGIAGNRVLHFRVTARDSHPGFGGLGKADVALTLAPGAGPFRVTSQAAPAVSGGTLPVTWDVAGTGSGTAVNTANVKITMSLDGGQSFDRVLAASTPNDGAETVTLPRTATTAGRVRVEAIGNVFYDVSHADLTTFVLSAPGSADLGSGAIGAAGAPVTITVANDGTTSAPLGAPALGGADGGAVAIVQNSCDGVTLAAHASCTVAVRLTPAHAGAHRATLTVPTADAHSPVTVALTGSGPAPIAPPAERPGTTPIPPPLTARQRATALAASLLGAKTPVLLGTAGNLRVFAATKSSKLGTPKARRTIAAATCFGGTCRGRATAKLTLTSRTGKRTSRTISVATIKLADGKGVRLTLKLSAKTRRAIAAARKASLRLTVTNGKAKVTKTYTLTT